MNKGISKEMEIREVMKWQLLIAGAVDAAIKGTESYIRHMEKPKCGFPTSCKQRFPQPQKSSQLPTFPHRRLLRKKTLSYLSFIKNIFKELIGNQERKHGLHGTRPYRGTHRPNPCN